MQHSHTKIKSLDTQTQFRKQLQDTIIGICLEKQGGTDLSNVFEDHQVSDSIEGILKILDNNAR